MKLSVSIVTAGVIILGLGIIFHLQGQLLKNKIKMVVQDKIIQVFFSLKKIKMAILANQNWFKAILIQLIMKELYVLMLGASAYFLQGVRIPTLI